MKISTIQSIKALLLITLLMFMLFACSEQQVKPVASPSINSPQASINIQDGPPDTMIDVTTISNAVPKRTAPSRYGNPESYTVLGKRYYVMPSSYQYKEKGIASWYGTKFHGKRTSSGTSYDMHGMTAAHKTLPLPTYVKVTNLNNKRQVILKVNDRGPFHENRIIDLSHTAAIKLGIKGTGTGWVEVEAIHLIPQTSIGSKTLNKTLNKANTMTVYLQLGVFSQLEYAQKFNNHINLLISPYKAHINKKLKNSQQKYYVRIGPLNNAEEVDLVAYTLRQKGITQHYRVID